MASASVAALVVHYGLYYTGHLWFPYYVDEAVKNPGISTALGIVSAVVVGGALYLGLRERGRRRLRREAVAG